MSSSSSAAAAAAATATTTTQQQNKTKRTISAATTLREQHLLKVTIHLAVSHAFSADFTIISRHFQLKSNFETIKLYQRA
jgi:hypothetical protein